MGLSTTALYCCLDDLAEAFEEWERHRLIATARKRRRPGKLSSGETLFVMVLFHLSPFKDFKRFWLHGVERKHRNCFGELPSYGRFVALTPRLFAPFRVLIHSLSGAEIGIHIADSIRLAVHANPRISRNRVFKDLAARGHSTMGWVFGVKLHVVMNHKGALMAITITPGDADDRGHWRTGSRGAGGEAVGRQGRYLKKTSSPGSGKRAGIRSPAVAGT